MPRTTWWFWRPRLFVAVVLFIGPLCTPHGALAVCAGDCDDNGVITASELTKCVARILRCEGTPTGPCVSPIIGLDCGVVNCPACDPNGDGRITAGEITSGTFANRYGCPATGPCAGDCNGDRVVSADELSRCFCVLALNAPDCAACDANGDGLITAGDLTQVVTRVLSGCPPQ